MTYNDVTALAIDGDLIWVGTAQVWDPDQEGWFGGGLARLERRVFPGQGSGGNHLPGSGGAAGWTHGSGGVSAESGFL